MDWIQKILSAWIGHRQFAEWLVSYKSPDVIVELGVDYGYSTFVFAKALQGTSGKIYGIDLFIGDEHAGARDTYAGVMDNIHQHSLTNIEIIIGDFTTVSQTWDKPIDILHIDGLHTYEAVKNDFTCWSKFVKDDGVILFHDIAVPHFGIKKFFSEIEGGYKLYFTHSAGLGIWTKNKVLYDSILATFHNCRDFSVPF
jgi:predicted O-methyltransferase YrrM